MKPKHSPRRYKNKRQVLLHFPQVYDVYLQKHPFYLRNKKLGKTIFFSGFISDMNPRQDKESVVTASLINETIEDMMIKLMQSCHLYHPYLHPLILSFL